VKRGSVGNNPAPEVLKSGETLFSVRTTVKRSAEAFSDPKGAKCFVPIEVPPEAAKILPVVNGVRNIRAR